LKRGGTEEAEETQFWAVSATLVIGLGFLRASVVKFFLPAALESFSSPANTQGKSDILVTQRNYYG